MRTNFSRTGWIVGLFFIVLYIICLGWQFLLTDPALKTLHIQLLALSLPGFAWLSVGSFIWGAVLSFIYGWIGAGIFVWLHRSCCGRARKIHTGPNDNNQAKNQGSCCH